ncbi:hypothetical protein Rin_00015030 [Candidatus Regiella insecticola 5.15]|uniref:Uncharacterized protein n=1 Tax=Candidatus Regiella insecticola 5.15 TaxID=1005043 RepID=G2H0C4_9ENTR|nr:hypothetical protein [Candidatus Regiella insecticola]EGY28547.1 hypothetical protein Rin_00015030 [Candidatus Regiella insecticola 5.15]
MNFELRQGSQGVRPMSVDKLRDSASTRSQRRRNLKDEGYIKVNERWYRVKFLQHRNQHHRKWYWQS